MPANDDLHVALAALLAATDEPAADVRRDAAAVAAAVSHKSPGAPEAWAAAFETGADGFEQRAFQLGFKLYF